MRNRENSELIKKVKKELDKERKKVRDRNKNRKDDVPATVEDLREEFVELSRAVMLNYLSGALGRVDFRGSGIQREQVWQLLRDMMLQAGDRTKMNVHGGDIEKQVKKILRKVSRGKMSPDVAKEYIGLLQAGLNLSVGDIDDEKGLTAKLIINTTKRK